MVSSKYCRFIERFENPLKSIFIFPGLHHQNVCLCYEASVFMAKQKPYKNNSLKKICGKGLQNQPQIHHLLVQMPWGTTGLHTGQTSHCWTCFARCCHSYSTCLEVKGRAAGGKKNEEVGSKNKFEIVHQVNTGFYSRFMYNSFFSTLALVNMLFGVFLHKSAKYRAESRQID